MHSVPYGRLAVFAFGFYYLTLAGYRLLFHPLRKFPGPKLAALSDIWLGYVTFCGRPHYITQDLHEKYGPIVRVAPNQLSFATPSSYQDIYARSGSRKIFTKTEFYDFIGGLHTKRGLGTERSPEENIRKKKLVAPLFSAQALLGVESIFQHQLNKFMQRVEKEGGTAEGVDITEWSTYLAFDIAGQFVLGQDFGAVDSGSRHRWISLILDNAAGAAIIEIARRFYILRFLIKTLLAERALKVCRQHIQLTIEKMTSASKEASKSGQPRTVLTYLVEQQVPAGISDEEITANATELILGAAEGVSTSFTIIMYYLLTTPRVLELLEREIREAFEKFDEIVVTSVTNLPYLTAVIKEGLRICPANPCGWPRYSPGEDIDGFYIPEGTQVSTHPWTLCRSPVYFANPDEFRPERWDDSDPSNCDNKEASQPFLLGPRQCPGQTMAWIEMRLFFAKILFLYDMKLANPKDELDPWLGKTPTYFLIGKAPLRVHLTRREESNGV
ncbi:cytochrome P450 [Wilcoxina mikolae CBS 423.85]|nr:cytochrome P450 [Wilcoxina mikolae CBS 423.85]